MLNQNRIRCQIENAAFKEHIQTLKKDMMENNNQALKVDALIQDSLATKKQLDLLTIQKRMQFKDVKAVKGKVPANSMQTSLEKLEMPLRFLKQNQQHLSPQLGQDFLRHLTTSLLENLLIKDKSLENIQAQNINLSLRLADFLGEKDAKKLYNPYLQALKTKKNDSFQPPNDPIV